MTRIKPIFTAAFLVFIAVFGTACEPSTAGTLEAGRKIAEAFVRDEATFRFDGMADTLEVAGTTAVGEGWEFTIEFDSRHAGYGDRGGQVLAEVLTHHTAVITVQDESVTAALIDGQWDMINQRIDVEIKPAPIDEVKVNILKSNPPQISVYIKGGLADGCTTFHNIETVREGNTINIKVTVQRPRGVSCPAIYTWFEKEVNLGTDFAFGTTYTLNVNDYSTTFDGTLMKYEDIAVYLT